MKRAFTLIELLVILVVIGVLITIVVVLNVKAKDSARRMQCTNNLKQMTLATHNFHDINKNLPKANFQPQFCHEKYFDAATGGFGNREFYGILPTILPYLEQNATYEMIMREMQKDGEALTPWDINWKTVPVASIAKYPNLKQPPWEQFSGFLCPSDGFARNRTDDDFGRTNYHGCRGDIWVDWKSKSRRGVFVSGPGEPIGMKDIIDGTSNTVMFAESAVGNNHGGAGAPVRGGLAYGMPYGADAVPMRCLERADEKGRLLTGMENHDVLTDAKGSGLCWLSGLQVNDQFFTILPPNAPSCSSDTDWQNWAMIGASNNHVNGCNVALADGSVQFVNNDIDCGNLNRSAVDVFNEKKSYYKNQKTYATAEDVGYGKSPWGIWGAIGSRAEGIYGLDVYED